MHVIVHVIVHAIVHEIVHVIMYKIRLIFIVQSADLTALQALIHFQKNKKLYKIDKFGSIRYNWTPIGTI